MNTTIEHIRNRMLMMIAEMGSQRAAALALGISQAHLSDILRGHRNPGPKTLAALGLEEVTGYRPAARTPAA